jgi:hypothetical protein
MLVTDLFSQGENLHLADFVAEVGCGGASALPRSLEMKAMPPFPPTRAGRRL